MEASREKLNSQLNLSRCWFMGRWILIYPLGQKLASAAEELTWRRVSCLASSFYKSLPCKTMRREGGSKKKGTTLKPTALPQFSSACQGQDSLYNINSRPKEQHLCNDHVRLGAQVPCQPELRKRQENSWPPQSSAHLHTLLSPAKTYISFHSRVRDFPSNHGLFVLEVQTVVRLEVLSEMTALHLVATE